MDAERPALRTRVERDQKSFSALKIRANNLL
jgi:hypothetical protein